MRRPVRSPHASDQRKASGGQCTPTVRPVHKVRTCMGAPNSEACCQRSSAHAMQAIVRIGGFSQARDCFRHCRNMRREAWCGRQPRHTARPRPVVASVRVYTKWRKITSKSRRCKASAAEAKSRRELVLDECGTNCIPLTLRRNRWRACVATEGHRQEPERRRGAMGGDNRR